MNISGNTGRKEWNKVTNIGKVPQQVGKNKENKEKGLYLIYVTFECPFSDLHTYIDQVQNWNSVRASNAVGIDRKLEYYLFLPLCKKKEKESRLVQTGFSSMKDLLRRNDHMRLF